MKSILIISFSPISRDPRVMRQVELLAKIHKVTVVGFGPKPPADIDYVNVDSPARALWVKILWGLKLFIGLFESYYWNLPWVKETIRSLNDQNYDLIIANDISALPLALRLAETAPVLLDAHEYSPREFEESFRWRILFKRYNEYVCRSYINKTSSMITVCQGIADEYEKNYGIEVRVVYNSPEWQAMTPSPVSEGKIRLIHHGLSSPSRHLELMIETARLLDSRFQLDLMLIEPDAAYAAKLRDLASEVGRVRFIEPVAMTEICSVINKYDIGIYILRPANFNHQYALPNKFFEFIQANLAVAIGPSLEMAGLVRKYSCGVVADSFEPAAMANALNSLTDDDIYSLKVASGIAAKELNYKKSSEVLLSEVARLL